jgi:glucosylceramidase
MSSGFAGTPTALAWGGTGGAPASSPEVNVWVTTADGQMKLSKQTPVAFTTSAPGHETLVVDPTRKFQTMTGFGGSITDTSGSR